MQKFVLLGTVRCFKKMEFQTENHETVKKMKVLEQLIVLRLI